MVHLSLTLLNFLALESANFPSPNPAPQGRMQEVQPNHPRPREPENPRNPNTARDLLTGACACSCSCYPQFPFLPTSLYDLNGTSETL